ncbi:hypothetical protein BDR05DRAFT_942722 [Suillus weaverae]|nr:hypothetical protein BDR05DRAFT_942722 [Suillus weaverae]
MMQGNGNMYTFYAFWRVQEIIIGRLVNAERPPKKQGHDKIRCNNSTYEDRDKWTYSEKEKEELDDIRNAEFASISASTRSNKVESGPVKIQGQIKWGVSKGAMHVSSSDSEASSKKEEGITAPMGATAATARSARSAGVRGPRWEDGVLEVFVELRVGNGAFVDDDCMCWVAVQQTVVYLVESPELSFRVLCPSSSLCEVPGIRLSHCATVRVEYMHDFAVMVVDVGILFRGTGVRDIDVRGDGFGRGNCSCLFVRDPSLTIMEAQSGDISDLNNHMTEVSSLLNNGVPFAFILYADKIHLTSSGHVKAYPVIACCANLPVHIRNGDGIGGGRVVSWLPIAFKKLLESIILYSKTGFVHECFDAIMRWLYPLILLLSADYEEHTSYPTRTVKDAKAFLELYLRDRVAGEEVLKAHGLHPITNVLWEVENSNPHETFSFNPLHVNDIGNWGNHLFGELKTHVKALGREAEDSAVMAKKLRDIAKQMLYAARNVLRCSEDPVSYALLQCIALNVHTKATLAAGEAELQVFETCLHAYIDIQGEDLTKNWNFPKVLKLDHISLVSKLIRSRISHLDEDRHKCTMSQRQLEDEDTLNDQPFSGHLHIGAPQVPVSLAAMEEGNTLNCAFQDFQKKFTKFLNNFVISNNIPLADSVTWLQPTANDKLQEHRYLKVNYKSTVDWKLTTDYLQCNLNFHGCKHRDCALIHTLDKDGIDKNIFVWILFMFKFMVSNHTFELALVLPMDAPTGSRRSVDRDLGLTRLQARSLASSEFISLQSIICGALLVPDDDHDGDFFLVDLINMDMFLHAKTANLLQVNQNNVKSRLMEAKLHLIASEPCLTHSKTKLKMIQTLKVCAAIAPARDGGTIQEVHQALEMAQNLLLNMCGKCQELLKYNALLEASTAKGRQWKNLTAKDLALSAKEDITWAHRCKYSMMHCLWINAEIFPLRVPPNIKLFGSERWLSPQSIEDGIKAELFKFIPEINLELMGYKNFALHFAKGVSSIRSEMVSDVKSCAEHPNKDKFLKTAKLVWVLKVALFRKSSLSTTHAPAPKTKGKLWQLRNTILGMIAAAAVVATRIYTGTSHNSWEEEFECAMEEGGDGPAFQFNPVIIAPVAQSSSVVHQPSASVPCPLSTLVRLPAPNTPVTTPDTLPPVSATAPVVLCSPAPTIVAPSNSISSAMQDLTLAGEPDVVGAIPPKPKPKPRCNKAKVDEAGAEVRRSSRKK